MAHRNRATVVLAGLAVVVAACSSTTKKVAQPASSRTPPVPSQPVSLLWVQSASGGSLVPTGANDGSYKLTLTGVDPHAIYFADRPNRQTGLRPVADMLTSLGYAKGDPPPNAAIVIAGANPDEDVRAVQLANPSYAADQATITYDARPLDKLSPGLAQFGDQVDPKVPEQFGRVSLFVDDAYNRCRGALYNNTRKDIRFVSADKWDTDSWDQYPAGSIAPRTYSWWQSTSGVFRGCGNNVAYQLASGVKVTVSMTDPYSGGNTYNCDVNPAKNRCYLWEDSTTGGDTIYIDYWVDAAGS